MRIHPLGVLAPVIYGMAGSAFHSFVNDGFELMTASHLRIGGTLVSGCGMVKLVVTNIRIGPYLHCVQDELHEASPA